MLRQALLPAADFKTAGTQSSRTIAGQPRDLSIAGHGGAPAVEPGNVRGDSSDCVARAPAAVFLSLQSQHVRIQT